MCYNVPSARMAAHWSQGQAVNVQTSTPSEGRRAHAGSTAAAPAGQETLFPAAACRHAKKQTPKGSSTCLPITYFRRPRGCAGFALWPLWSYPLTCFSLECGRNSGWTRREQKSSTRKAQQAKLQPACCDSRCYCTIQIHPTGGSGDTCDGRQLSLKLQQHWENMVSVKSPKE